MHRPKSIEELVWNQLRRSQLLGEPGSEKHPCVGPVVTISRTMGSGARVIAEKVAEDLGWDVWNKELLEIVAGNARVTRELVESFDEKRRSEISLLIQSALGNHEPAGFLYTKHISRAIIEVACAGSCVIIGRGANFLLPDSLHVRIDASLEQRIRNMMKFEGLTHTEAEQKLRASDKERRDFLMSTYGKERVDGFHYDISLWMDKLTNEDAVEIIKTAVRNWMPSRV